MIQSAGLIKSPVRLATSASLPSYTYLSQTITATGNGALSIDGTTVAIGDRILVKNESTLTHVNGIYVVNNPGSVSQRFLMLRANDFNGSDNAIFGCFVPVVYGSTNANSVFLMSFNALPLVFDTDPISFVSRPANLPTFSTNSLGCIKAPVQYATTTALSNSPTYSAGVLAATTNGALSVDGVAVSMGDRILVANEATTTNNGIYLVRDAGSASTPYNLVRASDANSTAQLPDGFVLQVLNGTENIGMLFLKQGVSSGFVLDTSPFVMIKQFPSIPADVVFPHDVTDDMSNPNVGTLVPKGGLVNQPNGTAITGNVSFASSQYADAYLLIKNSASPYTITLSATGGIRWIFVVAETLASAVTIQAALANTILGTAFSSDGTSITGFPVTAAKTSFQLTTTGASPGDILQIEIDINGHLLLNARVGKHTAIANLT